MIRREVGLSCPEERTFHLESFLFQIFLNLLMILLPMEKQYHSGQLIIIWHSLVVIYNSYIGIKHVNVYGLSGN